MTRNRSARGPLLRRLIITFLGWFTLLAQSRAGCVAVADASAAGTYGPGYYYDRAYLATGYGPAYGGEVRNWFVFNLPSFSSQLVAAELRIFAGQVLTTDEAETYEIHEVTTALANLINYSGNVTNTFADLGDGAIFTSRSVSTNEGLLPGVSSYFGALLRLPFNAAGLSALTAKQGSSIALGGAVSTLRYTNEWEILFGSVKKDVARPHLVLYFSSSSEPVATLLPFLQDPLAGERFSLEGTACGKSPLALQWLLDGRPIPGAASDILEIKSFSRADAGTYELQGSNDLGVTLSAGVSIPFKAAKIYTQPASINVLETEEASLYVTAFSWLPLSYQWRKDGVALPGQTSFYLLFSSIQVEDAGSYDAVISNSGGSVTSAVATVTVRLRPASFPYDSSEIHYIPVGLPLQLSRYSYGTPPISYQWYKDGQPFPGATSNYFSVASTTFDYAGDYRVIASNAAGSATSQVMRVIVTALNIYGPIGTESLYLNPASLAVSFESSTSVSLQWFFNNAPIQGATNSYLSFSAVDFSNQGPYFVIASNRYGMATSEVASITVITQAPSAVVMITSPYRRIWVGDDVALSASVRAGPPATIHWQFNGADLPSETNSLLRLVNAKTSDSGDYSIVATNIYGAVTSAPVQLTVVAEAPFFTSIPAERTELAGSIVTLRVQAVGGPRPTYQWRRNGVDLSGQTNSSLVLQNAQLADAGPYEVVARNDLGEATHTQVLKIRSATGLDRWRWSLPKAQGSRLHDVVFGNDRYVAVGKSGNIIVSTNGTDWTSVIIEADSELESVSFANGVFVATGQLYDRQVRTNINLLNDSELGEYWVNDYFGLVLVSADGLHWTAGINPERDQLSNVAGANGLFVAGCWRERAFSYTSTDGLHWNAQPLGSVQALRHVVYGNGLFVADDHSKHYYSSNGFDWSVAQGYPPTYWLNALAFSSGSFVALENGLNLLRSDDGKNWTRYDAGFPISYYPNRQGIAAGAGLFVAGVGSLAGHVHVTSDGLDWSDVDTQTAQEIEAIIFVNGKFLAVGEAGTVTRSEDGKNWTQNEVANRIDYYGVTRGGNLVVAAGDAGTIQTSTDGQTWTQRTTASTRNLHTIGYGDGLFVAAGRRGAILTSPDAVTWTARPSGVTNYIERVARANGLWVAVGEGGAIVTSSNGTDWSASYTAVPLTDHEGIAYGKGLWVAAGGYFTPYAVSTIFTSIDGRTWTRQPFNGGTRLRDVAFGHGQFVAVGNDGLVAFSTNGATWNSTFTGFQNFRSVQYANGRFVTVGNDGTLMSCFEPANTNSWIVHRSRTSQNLHDVHLASDGTLIAVGNNGMILQSGDTRPRFLAIERAGAGLRLQIDSGIAEGVLRFEGSTDLRSWQTVPDPVAPVMEVPFSTPYRFWRLAGD